MRERDNVTNEIFNTGLKLIINRAKEKLDLLDNTTIVSNMYNNSKLFQLKNELDEIRLTKFSMVVYYKLMGFREYLKSNIKYGVPADNTSIKVLNLDDNHMDKVNNYIKALQLCIDKVNI